MSWIKSRDDNILLEQTTDLGNTNGGGSTLMSKYANPLREIRESIQGVARLSDSEDVGIFGSSRLREFGIGQLYFLIH